MANGHTSDWSLTHRILFRFTFLYWILYCIPQSGAASLLDILPWDTGRLTTWMEWPLQQISIWVGLRVFHLTGVAATFHPTGSGDTALDYVLALCIFVIAIIGTLLWTALDRRRPQYRTFDAWLRLILSFTLAAALLEYGFVKIFYGQFPQIRLGSLSETYGDSSPMGLLWNFMGASRWYTMFAGFAEVIPGVLLLFRRTRTLGALLAAAVMANVAALNYFYDVPVKLYSSHLLLLALFLAGPDLVALARLFFLRQQAQLRTDNIPASERRWIRRTGYGMQAAVILAAAWSIGYKSYTPYPADTSHTPLYGQYRLAHRTDTIKADAWSVLTMDDGKSMLVKMADGSYMRLDAKVDPQQKTIAITSKNHGDGLLHYSADPADARHLLVSGVWNKGTLSFDMQRLTADSYLLKTRGFHWVSEYPFNH